MSKVTTRNLTKIFDGEVVAVKDLNLEVDDGEFVVLLGPSGCGKSTTLLMVAGLETPTEGEIFFDEEAVTTRPPHHRDIAMVFQSYALYPHMRVEDNMGFGLKMRGVPKQEIARRVQEAAEILDIASLLKRRPNQLSGGQRQRVALGRAIVRNPRVFLLDEPLSNIDAKLRAQMRVELKKMHQHLGTTFIYVTHDQVEAMSMGDRIAVMRDGVLQQYGTPTDIYRQPANIFVAGFLGSPAINLFPGEILSHDGKPAFACEDCVWLLDRFTASAVETGRKVQLGVRPEDIVVARSGQEGETDLPSVLAFHEPVGSQLHLFVNVKNTMVTATVAPDFEVQPGETLFLRFKEGRVHLFDAESGRRIE